MLGFDIDDVVADTSSAFLRILHTEYGQTHFQRQHWTKFKIKDCEVTVDVPTIIEIFDRLYYQPIANQLQPLPGAIEVLRQLSDRTPITFVTARPTAEPIHEWLYAQDADLASRVEIYATNNHDGKVRPLKERHIRIFVDDRTETCDMLQANGIIPVLFAQSWNAEATCARITDWKNLEAVLLSQLSSLTAPAVASRRV